MAEGFRTFDHTGDLGLEVWAGNPERLYALAAEALLAQVALVTQVGEASGAAEDSAELSLEGDGPEDLLVHWLNTALLEADVRRCIWTRATVTRLTPGMLQGRLQGPRYDPLRHTALREVKAVSHHALALKLTPTECRCSLILDL